MKVLIIGDSLSLPGHTNSYEETWPCLLKKTFRSLDFISILRRGITSEILVTEGGDGSEQFPMGSDCLEHFRPDIVILQLGIVDCAPRLFSRNSLISKLINRLPRPLSKSVLTIIKSNRQRTSKRSYVDLDTFSKNFENYLSRCVLQSVVKVIAIAIVFPGQDMIRKNPTIIEAVHAYNDVLNSLAKRFEFFEVINPLSESNALKDIYSDGYHPNSKGNELVFHSLTETLKLYDK